MGTQMIQDHFALVVIAAVDALVIGAYTAISFVGVDPTYANRLSDVMLALSGVLGGVAVPKLAAALAK